MQHSIIIDTKSERVWPWLMQLGTGRAGWYSYDLIDNFGRESYQYIDPDLQNLTIGQKVNGFTVSHIKENKILVFTMGSFGTFKYELVDLSENSCELKVNLETKGPQLLLKYSLGLVHNLMQKKQLVEIKARAERPFSPAVERNKKYILEKLQSYYTGKPKKILEIGSGTGQHALYFTKKMPNLRWTATDKKESIVDMNAWLNFASDKQVSIQELTLGSETKMNRHYDAIFSANVLHIISASKALDLFKLTDESIKTQGSIIFYGPFKFEGQHTAASNEDFDQWLKTRSQDSGVRDFEWVNENLIKLGFYLEHKYKMPANNHMLIFKKH